MNRHSTVTAGARAPSPGDLTPEEHALLTRISWILRLHITAGTTLYVVTVAYWLIAPIPGVLHLIGGLILAVYAYVAVAWQITRAWQRQRRTPMSRLYRTILNALAVADIFVLVTVVHLGGGPHAPGLHLVVVPMVVYGAFLPRRDAYAHALLATVLLGAMFAGQHTGWLSHDCPPIAGAACQGTILEVLLHRYVSVVLLLGVATYLVTFIGISLRSQEEKSRALAHERGRLADMRSRFVTMASHEFRTPLAVILSASDVLKRYRARLTSEATDQRLDRIQSAVREMTRMLDGVLTLGRADARRESFSPQPLNLRALCDDVLRDVDATSSKSDRLCLSYEATSDEVMLDSDLVRATLRNLLVNAIKYSPDGGTVRLEVERGNDTIVFRVRDEGIGIPQADLPHLFEPFHRATNVGEVAGSGLGLAITKQAVAAQGGTICVESRESEGTTFVVELPCSRAHVAPTGQGGSDSLSRDAKACAAAPLPHMKQAV